MTAIQLSPPGSIDPAVKAKLDDLLAPQPRLTGLGRACRALTAARVLLELSGYSASKFVDHDPVGDFVCLSTPHPVEAVVRPTASIAHIGSRLARLADGRVEYQSVSYRLNQAIQEEYVIALLKPLDGMPIYLPVVEGSGMERDLARCLLLTIASLVKEPSKKETLGWQVKLLEG